MHVTTEGLEILRLPKSGKCCFQKFPTHVRDLLLSYFAFANECVSNRTCYRPCVVFPSFNNVVVDNFVFNSFCASGVLFFRYLRVRFSLCKEKKNETIDARQRSSKSFKRLYSDFVQPLCRWHISTSASGTQGLDKDTRRGGIP